MGDASQDTFKSIKPENALSLVNKVMFYTFNFKS